MPPRALTGTLFATATTVWWLLIGVLSLLVVPEGPALGIGFWTGAVLAALAGFGWGAALSRPLMRCVPASSRTAGVIRFAAAGAALLLLAGVTALLAGLALSALVSDAGAVWSTVRQALARRAALALPAAAVALIGLPFGAAAGVVLRALAAPGGGSPSALSGSRGRPLR